MTQTDVFDWQAHVRQLAEQDGLYPADIALDVVDKLVAAGDVLIDDESAKEIAYTEALNYAERHYREQGYEF